jgi:hypothetical protein
MAELRKIDMGDGKFLYRCDACGFESHKLPVPAHKLGAPPAHHCKQSEKAPAFDDDIYL